MSNTRTEMSAKLLLAEIKLDGAAQVLYLRFPEPENDEIRRETQNLLNVVYSMKLTKEQKLSAIDEYKVKWGASNALKFARLALDVVAAAIGVLLCLAATCLANPFVMAFCSGAGLSMGFMVGESIARHTFFARPICVDQVVAAATDVMAIEAAVPTDVVEKLEDMLRI